MSMPFMKLSWECQQLATFSRKTMKGHAFIAPDPSARMEREQSNWTGVVGSPTSYPQAAAAA